MKKRDATIAAALAMAAYVVGDFRAWAAVVLLAAVYLATKLPYVREEGGWVYFIEAAEAGSIKIGVTRGEPSERLSALQTGNSYGLQLLYAVYCRDPFAAERELHKALDLYRLEGEWFIAKPVYGIIQQLRNQQWDGEPITANAYFN